MADELRMLVDEGGIAEDVIGVDMRVDHEQMGSAVTRRSAACSARPTA